MQQCTQFSINSAGRLATLIVASFVPLLFLAPLAIGLYVGVGTSAPQVIMGFVALTVLLIWPLFRLLGADAEGKIGAAFLLLGIIPTIVFMTTQHFDARHPRGEELFYVVNVDQQNSFWASRDVSGGGWLERFIGNDAIEFDWGEISPGPDNKYLTRPTAMADTKPAEVRVVSDRVESGERTLDLHLQSPSAAGFITILVNTEAEISAISVNSIAVDVPDEIPEAGWWPLRWIALPASGGNLSLTLSVGQVLNLRILESDWELPSGAPDRLIPKS